MILTTRLVSAVSLRVPIISRSPSTFGNSAAGTFFSSTGGASRNKCFTSPFLSRTVRHMSTAQQSNDEWTSESLFEHISSTTSTTSSIGNNIPDAMYTLYTADVVCFDVDSTVIAEEGIDVLADFLGKGQAVAELTKRAMEGDTKFQDALKMRLDLMQPSKQQIESCLQQQPLVLSPGIEELMGSLQAKNIDIWLVSGGFRIMIEPIAERLNISKSNIYANTLLFDFDGLYESFDATEPTSQDMGKPRALQLIKDSDPEKYKTMIMVGDGATDAQAKPPATAFIGFGGVIQREAVKEKADWFVTDFSDMTKVVNLRK